jgi:hypothetical protein
MEAKASEIVELKGRLMKIINSYAALAQDWHPPSEDDYQNFENTILDTMAEYVVETREGKNAKDDM